MVEGSCLSWRQQRLLGTCHVWETHSALGRTLGAPAIWDLYRLTNKRLQLRWNCRNQRALLGLVVPLPLSHHVPKSVMSQRLVVMQHQISPQGGSTLLMRILMRIYIHCCFELLPVDGHYSIQEEPIAPCYIPWSVPDIRTWCGTL